MSQFDRNFAFGYYYDDAVVEALEKPLHAYSKTFLHGMQSFVCKGVMPLPVPTCSDVSVGAPVVYNDRVTVVNDVDINEILYGKITNAKFEESVTIPSKVVRTPKTIVINLDSNNDCDTHVDEKSSYAPCVYEIDVPVIVVGNEEGELNMSCEGKPVTLIFDTVIEPVDISLVIKKLKPDRRLQTFTVGDGEQVHDIDAVPSACVYMFGGKELTLLDYNGVSGCGLCHDDFTPMWDWFESMLYQEGDGTLLDYARMAHSVVNHVYDNRTHDHTIHGDIVSRYQRSASVTAGAGHSPVVDGFSNEGFDVM